MLVNAHNLNEWHGRPVRESRAKYACQNQTFFAPILLGRLLMRVTGLRPASENNITIGALNGLLGRILGSESWWLRSMNFPFGVSIVCVAKKI